MQIISHIKNKPIDDSGNSVVVDWIFIENLTGVNFLLENISSPEGNTITEIVYDFSNDGVTVSSTGTLEIEFENNTLRHESINNAGMKYIRISASCDTDKTTTIEAWLMADSSNARICTLADVKDRLGMTDKTDCDAIINSIITGIETMFVGYCNRELIQPAADVTEYFTGNGDYIQLNRYPIINITSIKQSVDYDFTDADILVANDDYRLINGGKKGIIRAISSYWLRLDDSIQVIYRGGYCPVGQTPAAGEIALPADIREAAIIQATFMFKRKDDPGLSSINFQSGSISKFADMDLLPIVKNVLDNYKRVQL